ncbi:GNAT family N-acetyltransferase [Rhodococcus sp. NPDC127528]|uniref:GNAT family N-acetyltransferase n=1 Tax=unclassified Rhodococcus (in: high G+C Gram-positive bacteria) TaxID=192944 RepID=UPI00363B73FA
MTVTIAMAGPGDAAALAVLGEQSYRSHFGALWTPAGLDAYVAVEYGGDRILREIAGESTGYLLARVDGELAGFAKVTVDREVPLSDRSGLELEKVYLLPEFTGAGHGSALIGAVLDFADEHGQALVWLDVLKENEGGRRVYERHGFTVAGELPFATDVREIGFWVMTRPASGPTAGSAGAATGRRYGGTARSPATRQSIPWA